MSWSTNLNFSSSKEKMKLNAIMIFNISTDFGHLCNINPLLSIAYPVITIMIGYFIVPAGHFGRISQMIILHKKIVIIKSHLHPYTTASWESTPFSVAYASRLRNTVLRFTFISNSILILWPFDYWSLVLVLSAISPSDEALLLFIRPLLSVGYPSSLLDYFWHRSTEGLTFWYSMLLLLTKKVLAMKSIIFLLFSCR